jgi:MscS family membrane protein
LVTRRLGGIPLHEWLIIVVGIPLIYLATFLLNRLLGIAAGKALRRLHNKPDLADPEVLFKPVRLLIVALIIYAAKYHVGLTLLARQFCTGLASVTTFASCVWLLILWNGKWETYLRLRLERQNSDGAASMVRLGRRAVDIVVIVAGVLAGLQYFRFNITAALAGLWVGGIAVALAAQKTLENVIGGISIVMDKVIQVGDFIKVGDISGAVEDIGLRSIRLRTNDRSVVSIPNGQIASISLENFSRDKFWLRHLVGLRYDTCAS